jgi:hypothetical protein
VDGSIIGIRFYKGMSDPGEHTGSLWSSAGTLLATGTFVGETASGWQQLDFATPVTITANTTYIASYHTTAYYYSNWYFENGGVDNGPLHALQSGVDGDNGVYVYASGGVFPREGFVASNYWVDVVFSQNGTPSSSPPSPQSIIAVSGTPQSTVVGTPFGSALQAKVTDASSNPVPNFSVTFAAPSSGPTASFAGVLSSTAITNSAGIATSPVPIAMAMAGSYTVTASISGLPPALFALTNTPASSGTTSETGSTIFSASATPTTFSIGSPVELGVKFRSEVNGTVTGIRFYKVPGDSVAHTGSFWSSAGTLLATGTFSNETASGWQQLNFSTPVSITANTTYVASYHTSTFYYSYYFFQTAGVDNSPLHALQNGVDGGNGVYVYGPGGVFPNQSDLASNYWVDIVFSANPASAPPSNNPPVVNAGPNQQIALPAAASLSGTATDDGLPNGTLTVMWTVVSGPGTVTFANATAASTTATFSAAGTYVLQLTASDGAASATSATSVNVNANGSACGQTVSKTVTLTANVTSSVGITAVQFQLDGTNLGPLLTTSPYSFNWDTTTVTNGCHVITATAQDTNGNIGTATVIASVTNP